MSFEIDGVLVQPDYRAKEKRLYQIIASRESEIAALKATLEEANELRREAMSRWLDTQAELRALRAKERRRATKRKKGREQPGD